MIDKNEAPEGYYAVKVSGIITCHECYFHDDEKGCLLVKGLCTRKGRKDKTDVIFKKKEAQV